MRGQPGVAVGVPPRTPMPMPMTIAMTPPMTRVWMMMRVGVRHGV